jgi:hypothetical protein
MIDADPTAPPSLKAEPRLTPAIVIASLVLVVWGVLIIIGPVDWDLAWQMHLADRMLAGKKLFVDVGVTEQHPPLLTWMCVGVTWMARLLRLEPLRFFLSLTVIASIAASFVALRIARGNAVLLAGFGAASLAMHVIAGGSGEQMSSALSLPYLAAAAAYIHGRRFSRRDAVALGVVAGLGLALKPHYALVWLFEEIAVAAHAKTWRTLFRLESLSAAAVWVAYIIATLAITPAYFHAAMQAAVYYGAFMQRTLPQVLASSPWRLMLLAWLAWVFSRRFSQHATLALLLILSATAMYIAAVVQMKGWYHHWTPAIALAVAALAALAPLRARHLALAMIIAGSSLWLAHWQKQARYAQQVGPTYLPAMMKLVARRAPHGPLLILDNGLAAGFPLVNFTHAEWTLTESCLWMVAGLYRDQWNARKPIHYRSPSEWIPFEREVHDLIWRGVQERPPRLVLIPGPVDEDRFDFRKFVETDPRMASFLSGWRPVDRVGPYIVYMAPIPTAAQNTDSGSME